ncbi:hypothetical protein OSB04_007052, partial [Centaurea solstitialis]
MNNQSQVDVNFDFDENEFAGETIAGKVFDKLEEVLKVDKFGVDTKKRQRDSRTGCEAELQVSKIKDGKWVIDKFSDIHIHDLTTTPIKVMKHRSHVKFHRPMACKSLMVKLGQYRFGSSQIKKVVNAIKYPFEVDVTSKQCVDILADGRSRDSYMKFGDVFDVTYMTNKFKKLFSPFVGVNRHGQSILFGGALLANETEETFEWLFENFLKYMFSKYPKSIITDQDKAMGNAIKKVLPSTRHRYCAWHIRKHELEHNLKVNGKFYVISIIYKVVNGRGTCITNENFGAIEEDEDFKTINSMSIPSSVHLIEAKK